MLGAIASQERPLTVGIGERSCAGPRFSTTRNSPDARKEQDGGQGGNEDFSGLPSKSYRPALGTEGRYGAVGEAGNGNANTIVGRPQGFGR